MSDRLQNPRQYALIALVQYQKSRKPPDEILGRIIPKNMPDDDRALAWEITMGVVRYLKKLDFIAQAYVKAPLSSQKPWVLAALRMGLYQLTEMTHIPQFAAVDEAVKSVSRPKSQRDAGFVNAVLRSFLREPDKVDFPDPAKEPVQYLSAFYSYPGWLVQRWYGRYGFNETEKMLAANNRRPNTSFKMITGKMAAEKIKNLLQKDEIEYENGRYFPDYISSTEGSAIIKSGLFKDGYLIVQDESQGLPAYLLEPEPGAEALDLCSAPGGKTVSIAERVGPGGKVVSLDLDPIRMKKTRENAGRVEFGNIEFTAMDLLKFAPGKKFKYILLDVPCSGLGTMMHNVDLKWSKRESDIGAFSRLQLKFLEKSSEWLSNDGRLVYSTCTTEPEEIEQVVEGFLKGHPNFYLEDGASEHIEQFKTQTGIYRTWPHEHGIGGGGFALLRKRDGV